MNTEQQEQGPGDLQHDAEHARTRKRVSVMGYLAILFLAAFLFLLLAYFMQQRQQQTNEETISGLQQTSNSAVQTLENILSERDALKSRNAALEEETQALKERQTALEEEAQSHADTIAQLERETIAMQWFWQIDDYYARGYYTNARTLITDFEAKGLKDALPAENTTGTDRFAPAQRYQEIYEALY